MPQMTNDIFINYGERGGHKGPYEKKKPNPNFSPNSPESISLLGSGLLCLLV